MHSSDELSFIVKEVNEILEKTYHIDFVQVNENWVKEIIDKPLGGTFSPEEIAEIIIAKLDFQINELKGLE